MRYALLALALCGCFVGGCARTSTEGDIPDGLKKRVLELFSCRAFDANGKEVGIFTFSQPGVLSFDFNEGVTGEIPIYGEFIDSCKVEEFRKGFCCAGEAKVFDSTGVLFCAHDGYECVVDLRSGRGFLRVPIFQDNGKGGLMDSGDGQYLSLRLLDEDE